MAKTPIRQVRSPRGARPWQRFAVGLALTAAFAALYLALPGRVELIEPHFQDVFLWRARPATPPSEAVTVVEIDNAALERIEKWPWSWTKIAGCVDSLAELGARTIVLDITFNEYPRPEVPEGSRAGETVQALDPLEPLAGAIRRAGCVAVAYTFSPRKQVVHPLYARIEEALAREPGLASAKIAGRLGVATADVERYYVTALRRALEIRLSQEPPEGLSPERAEALFGQLFPAVSGEERLARMELFDLALDANLRLAALAPAGAVACESPPGGPFLIEAERLEPPLVELTRAAAGLGFAYAAPDPDGVIRKVPLAVEYQGKVFPQLALRAALLGRGHGGIRFRRPSPLRLEVLSDGGPPLVIPTRPDGDVAINWSCGPSAYGDNLPHLPIGKIYEHYVLRRQLPRFAGAVERVAALAGDYDRLMNDLAALRPDGQARAELCRQRDQARQEGRSDTLAELERRIQQIDDRLAMDMMKLVARPVPANVAPQELEKTKKALPLIQRYAQEKADADEEGRLQGGLARLRGELAPYVEGRVCAVGMTATSMTLDLKPTPIHPNYPGVAAQATVIDNLLRGRFVTAPSPTMAAALLCLVGLAVTLLAGRLPTVPAALGAIGVLLAYYLLALALFIRGNYLMPLAGPVFAGAASLLGVMVYRELTEGRNRRWITGVFKQYTSDKMVDELVANPQFLVLGGERREMTVYFSDIAGFTGLAERLDPPTLVAFLQTYLEEMTDRLLEEGATLDKYEGDAIVAFFGAPVAVPDHAARCLRAALAHLRALPVLNEKLKRARLLPEGAELKIRIGISTGQMVVGNFGSTRRFDYTVMGDAVNVGARLEGANRFFGTTVLLSGATRDQALRSFSEGGQALSGSAAPQPLSPRGRLYSDRRGTPCGCPSHAESDKDTGGDKPRPYDSNGISRPTPGATPKRSLGVSEDAEFLLRRIGPVRLSGKAETVEVYELLDGAAAGARAGLDLYDAALADFERGQFEPARAKFQEVLEVRPADGPTLAYLARLDALQRDGLTSPPGAWDMTSK